MTEPNRWAVGVVKTGSETKVSGRLRGMGIETYCPTYETVVRRWRRRRPETVTWAVFQGYVFMDEATIGNFVAVAGVLDFYHFLRWPDDGRLQIVPSKAMADLMALEFDGILPATGMEALVRRFEAGTAIRVVAGAFAGWRGTVASQNKGRVEVDGGEFKHPTEFPAELLEAT